MHGPHRGLVCLSVSILLIAGTAVALDLVYQWSHPSPQGNSVFGIVFADASTGWAVCGGGTVLRTDDAGVSWNVQTSLDGYPDLYDVVRLSDGTLIAAGEGMFRSTDGGDTWATVATPAPGHLRDLCHVPGGGVSAAGEGGAVIVSNDGGLTWTGTTPTGTGAVRHHLWRSALEGYMVGENGVHHTTDGGTTWSQFGTATFGYNEVYFTDALTGFIISDFERLETVDGGVTWTPVGVFLAPHYRFRTLVLDPDHWLVTCVGEGQELWETIDGGVTWTQRVYILNLGFPGLAQAPGGRVFFGSNNGDIFYTDDNGLTYDNGVTNLAASSSGARIMAIGGRPDGVLFAANAPVATMEPGWFRSDDGGRTWTAPAGAPDIHYHQEIEFLDDDHGFSGHYDELVLTIDGGDTWSTVQLSSTLLRVADIEPVATDLCFLGCSTQNDDGGLRRSSDGGVTWSVVGGGLPAAWNAWVVDFPDPLNGYAGGELFGGAPCLFRTSNGGLTWTSVPVPSPALVTGMHWLDANTGLLTVRDWQDVGIFRTTDAGASWTRVSSERVNRFDFRDGLHGIAWDSIYLSTGFLATDDGGLTWEHVIPPFDGGMAGLDGGRVTSMAMTDEGVVIGSLYNRMMLGQDATTTAIEGGDEPVPGPVAARLFAGASPNPFNPMTTIELRLPAPGPARVSVHAVDGGLVRTLHDGPLSAGPHALTWDGRDGEGRSVPAGVYMARVVAGVLVDAGKLVLVK